MSKNSESTDDTRAGKGPAKRPADDEQAGDGAQDSASPAFESVDEDAGASSARSRKTRGDGRGDGVVIDADAHSADSGGTIALAADVLPQTLHVLPLTQRPFFPVQAMPLVLPEDPWLDTFKAAAETPHRLVGLLLSRPDGQDPPVPGDLHRIGTVVRVHNAARNEGRIQFIAEGVQRFQVQRWVSEEMPYVAQVHYLEESHEHEDKEIKAYAMATLAAIKELIPLNPLYSEELRLSVDRLGTNRPASLAFFAANLTSASGESLQKVLEERSLKARLMKVLELLHKELEVARLQADIRQQVESSMSKHQREFFLREQLKAIQKELGIAKDDRTAEIEEFKERLESRTPSESALARIEQEMDKLSVLERGSPEYAVTRNYLDWLTESAVGRAFARQSGSGPGS